MNNDLKNKFENFEVKPPDFILDNLKNELGFTKKPFLVKYKYPIVASVIGAIISLLVVLNNTAENNISENTVPTNNKIQQINNTNNSDNQETTYLNTQTSSKQKNKTKDIIIKPENNINKISKDKISEKAPAKQDVTKINIGKDIKICGNKYQLGENTNAKEGKWFAVNNVEFSEITNPKATIIAKTYGKHQFIWAEQTKDGIYYDTIVVNFIEIPKDLIIEKTNEHCNRADAIIKFITQNNSYTFKWSDGKYTSNPIRKGLTSDKYTVTVTNENTCSFNYSIEVINTEIVNANFYHTELYSAINTPIYFTDRTKVTTIDKNELKYEWDFGDGTTSNEINPEHTYFKAGEYIVKLTVSTKNNCYDTYSTKITIEEDLNIIPNIFTPNGDGIHDIFVVNPKPLSNFKGIIFNKAGQQVFEWDNQYEGWDGKLKNGETASEGVYYYIVSGIDSDGKQFQYRSFVHLSR